MKYLIKCVFILIIPFMFFGCNFNPINKFLTVENENSTANIVVIDDKNNQYKDTINKGWDKGWSEAILGDFELVYIKTENFLEGIFIISNKYKKKIIPYDIVINQYGHNGYIKRNEEARDKFDDFNQERASPYEIIIKVAEDTFKINYNYTKFDIQSYFNSDENYSFYKEKYFKEYCFNE
jgi:hypothetical protein